MMLDFDGRITRLTTHGGATFARADDSTVGRHCSMFYTAAEVQKGEPLAHLRLAVGHGWHQTEGWRVGVGGARFWADILTVALPGGPGRLGGFVRVIRDATRQKQDQSALEQSASDFAAQFDALLGTAVDAVITIDHLGRIESFNRAAEGLFGYRPSEVIGKNVRMLMPDPYRNDHDGYINSYLRTGRKKIIGIGREVVAVKKDLTTFPIDLAVSEVKLGQRRTFMGIIRDVTGRKRLEKEILEISEREQRRIGQDLHDGLCQQLTGIAFLVQALQQKLTGHASDESAQAAQISRLLKEAVNQARGLSHGLYPVSPQPGGLQVALEQLAANVGSVFKIRCDFKCRKPVPIGDSTVATHLYRIAQEAVQNAIRHGKASRITIGLALVRGGVRLSVADNGVGMPGTGELKPGLGLRTMSHRAHVIGGGLLVRRRASGGTQVDCELRNKVLSP